MTRRLLPKTAVVVMFGILIFGFSLDRGSAKDDPGDRKLEAFIEAAAAVEGVMAIWQPKIAGADHRKAEALRDQANNEIRESIEKVEGISFGEYREIRRAIAADSDMLARVTEIMRRQRQP